MTIVQRSYPRAGVWRTRAIVAAAALTFFAVTTVAFKVHEYIALLVPAALLGGFITLRWRQARLNRALDRVAQLPAAGRAGAVAELLVAVRDAFADTRCAMQRAAELCPGLIVIIVPEPRADRLTSRPADWTPIVDLFEPLPVHRAAELAKRLSLPIRPRRYQPTAWRVLLTGTAVLVLFGMAIPLLDGDWPLAWIGPVAGMVYAPTVGLVFVAGHLASAAWRTWWFAPQALIRNRRAPLRAQVFQRERSVLVAVQQPGGEWHLHVATTDASEWLAASPARFEVLFRSWISPLEVAVEPYFGPEVPS